MRILSTLLVAAVATVCMPVRADEPTMHLSITVPVQDPMTTALDVPALTYRTGWRFAPPDRPILGSSTAAASGIGPALGVQLAVIDGPFAVDIGVRWTSGSAVTRVDSRLAWQPTYQETVCPDPFAPPCWPGYRQRIAEQVNEHRIGELSMLLGTRYNFLHGHRYVSLSGGVGMQYWNVSDAKRTEHTSFVETGVLYGPPIRREVVEHTVKTSTGWRPRTLGYVSLDAQAWPGGTAHKGLGLTVQARYLFGDLSVNIRDVSLLEVYSIPVVQRRWQASGGLVVAF